jgi:3-dehydroquinate synthase
MRAAIHLGEALPSVSSRDAEELLELVERFGPIPARDGVRAERLLARLAHDKKTIKGNVHFVLPVRIGGVKVVSGVDEKLVLEAIRFALS